MRFRRGGRGGISIVALSEWITVSIDTVFAVSLDIADAMMLLY